VRMLERALEELRQAGEEERMKKRMEKTEPDHSAREAGTFVAYQPEFREWSGARWMPVTVKEAEHGTPYPIGHAGILGTIELYGLEQAQALAWDFAAKAEAVGSRAYVRIVSYKVAYEIKATRDETDIIGDCRDKQLNVTSMPKD